MWHKPHVLNAIADLLLLIGAAALLAVGTVWIVRMPSLPVKQVIFAGELPHTRRQEIEQVLPPLLRGNFFSVNVETVRITLEQLPWIRKAEVRRVWPARLEVKVEEHRPLARWGETRGELVNSYGEVFAALPPEDELKALPLLYGPPGTAKELLKRYSEFTGALKPLDMQPVQMTLSPRLAWQMKLSQGMLIDLGREQPRAPLLARLERFIEIYPIAVAQRATLPSVVDLRYPNGFAMRVANDVKGK